MPDSKAKIKFHFFDLRFTPHVKNANTENSKRILKQCIELINDERINKRTAIVIDRYEGRQDEEPRNLFISSAPYILNENRYKCKMALIRDNKLPTLVNRANYSLTPLDQLGDKAIAETTNFLIDMNGRMPIICCEFNNYGPRISDIEYYFRYLSSHNMLHISKACKVAVHMKMPINEVLKSITDVLRFKIKVKSNRLNFLSEKIGDAFYTNMNGLANSVSPKIIKIDAFFRDRADTISKPTKSPLAVAHIKRFLQVLKNDNDIADDIEDFYLVFEKDDGAEGIFNLMKGKQEIIIECPYKTTGNIDTKVLFEKMGYKFTEYLKNKGYNHENS